MTQMTLSYPGMLSMLKKKPHKSLVCAHTQQQTRIAGQHVVVVSLGGVKVKMGEAKINERAN